MLKKNPWIIGLSLAAFVLAPSLQAASAAKAAPASSEKADSATDKTAAGTDKADATTDSKSDTLAATANHKSAVIAGGLAFFPGVVVHGAGHMYAGSWMKGLGLLAIEGVSIGVVANSVSSGTNDITSLANSFKNNQVPTDVSGAYTKVGVILVGTMAFLWTWFDDMAGSPIAVKEYNKLQDEQQQAYLHFEPRLGGAQLALSTKF